MTWAVVMGASSPIGAACALKLAEDGHDIVVHYLHHEIRANEVAREVEELGCNATLVRHRLDRLGDTGAFCDAVTTTVARVDALLVASAAGVMRPIDALSEHHLNWTMQTSAIPLVLATKRFKPRAVVAISSLGANRVVANYAAVGMAKAALESAVRYLAVELAPTSRINAVSAGLVRTGAALRLGSFAALEQITLEGTPLGRLVKEADIAELVSFLLGPRAEMITGAVIPIDGGHSLRWQ